MKDKKLIILSLTLFSLVFLYAGTYAYYARVVNGTIAGRAGSFTFDVLYNNKTFTSINLYDTITGTPRVVSSDKVIVPGDSGSFVLTATAEGSLLDIEYTMVFKGSNVPSNMKFYLDENKTQVLDIDTNKIYGYLNAAEVMKEDYTIYWEWPYDSGRYNNLDDEYANKSITIEVKVDGKQNNDGMLVYGIKRDTSSTSTTWERIENSVGLEANAVSPTNTNVVNDFDNIYPWSEIKSYNYNAITRKVTAWYGDSNFSFDGSNGEVLTYIPGFYYKREVIDGIEYQYITKYEQEGYSYSEPFSVGRYKISGQTTGKSVNSVYPGNSATLATFRDGATNLGTDFSILDYHYYLLQMLYLVEYADYDSQNILGKGVTENSGGSILMGGTDSLGMKSGCLVNDGAHSMIYRGIEDIYGNTADFLDGINIKNYQAYINYDFTTYESNVFDGSYKTLGYANASSNGFITKVGYDSNNQLIGLPITGGTSTSGGLNDSYYSTTGNNILIVGGSYNNGTSAGLWLTNTESSDLSNNSVGSRLIRHQTGTGRTS